MAQWHPRAGSAWRPVDRPFQSAAGRNFRVDCRGAGALRAPDSV